MAFLSFAYDHLKKVGEALDIAEDMTGNFYKFSLKQWKRHRFDVKTLSSLDGKEITNQAFAMLHKGERDFSRSEYWPRSRDSYIICLQDHQILNALRRDKQLGLLPILVYVFTHELIHIVRFCNFSQRFDVSEKDKDKEEQIVHAQTYELLGDLTLPNLDYVLASYRNHRSIDMVVI